MISSDGYKNAKCTYGNDEHKQNGNRGVVGLFVGEALAIAEVTAQCFEVKLFGLVECYNKQEKQHQQRATNER